MYLMRRERRCKKTRVKQEVRWSRVFTFLGLWYQLRLAYCLVIDTIILYCK